MKDYFVGTHQHGDHKKSRCNTCVIVISKIQYNDIVNNLEVCRKITKTNLHLHCMFEAHHICTQATKRYLVRYNRTNATFN